MPADVNEMLQEIKSGIAKNAESMGELRSTVEQSAAATNTMSQRVDEIDARLKTAEETTMHIAKGRSVSLPGVDEVKDKFHITRYIAALKFGGKHLETFEGEVLREVKKRALDTTDGDALIPEELSADLVDALVAQQVMGRIGVRTLRNLVGTSVPIPRKTATGEAYWVGENDVLSTTQATFEQFTLAPHRIGAYTPISNRLIKNSIVDAEDMVRDDLLGALGRKIDKHFFIGSGSGDEPAGLINVTNTQEVGDATANYYYFDDLMESFVGALEDEDAMPDNGNYAWVSHPKAFRKLKGERVAQYSAQTDGEYVMLPMSDANLRDALEHPFYRTTQFPTNLQSTTNCTYMFFANWAQCIYAIWKSMAVGISTEASHGNSSAFLQDQTWIKVEAEVDFNVRQPKAVAWADDVKIT